MQFHFISGLPRSGSTLLASILNQNPAFHAGITSPMGPTVTKAREAMSPMQETHVMWTGDQQADVVRAIFNAYYIGYENKIVFDTNRRWCADASLLAHVFPDCRIICCVRSPVAIVASFEKYFRAHPVAMGVICQNNQSTTVFERVPMLMAPDGVVGYAYKAFRDAWFGPEKGRLIIVEYDNLVAHPMITLEIITRELGLTYFDYNFDCIRQIDGAAEFDKSIGCPGLHDLRNCVLPAAEASPTLPPEILDKLPVPFWR